MSSTISTCIIIKNEIENIPDLINDLRQFSDEIIMVDTGSTDGTLEWLYENQDDVLKLHHYDWIDHFGEARNYSFSKANKDWIFWCDADDRISPELIEELIKLKDKIDELDCTSIFINYLFSEGWDVPRRRLLKRIANPKWHGACHEYVITDNDKCLSIDDDKKIIHQRKLTHTDRNLNIFIKNILNGIELSTRDYVYYSNELRDAGLYEKAYDIALRAINRDDIWVVDAWNLILYNMTYMWMNNLKPYIEGINIIDKYEKKGEMRGDIYYVKGLLYKSLNDLENAKESFKKATTYESDQLLDYGELILNTKIYPAFELYELVDDGEKVEVVEYLKQYQAIEEVTEFLKKIGSI